MSRQNLDSLTRGWVFIPAPSSRLVLCWRDDLVVVGIDTVDPALYLPVTRLAAMT